MKYLVGEYEETFGGHKCTNEEGHKFYIDLMVSGDLQVDDEEYDQYMIDLSGKTVEIEMITHFVAIGHGIKVIS